MTFAPSPPARAKQAHRIHRRRPVQVLQQAACHVLLAIASIVILVPTLWLLVSAFKTPGEMLRSPWALPQTWNIQNFANAWTSIDLGRLLLNSVLVCGSSTSLTLVMAIICGYAIVFRASRYMRAIQGLFFSALFLPTDLVLLPIFLEMRSLHLLNNYLGVILPYAVFGMPLAVLLISQSMRSLPTGLAEAARVDGANDWRIMWTIITPIISPSIGAAGVLTIIGNWNEFLIALLILQAKPLQTVPIGLASFSTLTDQQPGLLLAAVVVTILPVLITFVIFQRSITQGVAAGAVR